MEEVEPPECPVCLQPYDAVTIIPRVLACGHTTCEPCLKLLSRPFPNATRCTVCTQLLKLPNSLSSLPKNLDLLYFSSLLQRGRAEEERVIPRSPPAEFGAGGSVSSPSLLKPWTYEFYCKWRKWILPEDCISIGKTGLGNDGGVLDGKVSRFFESDRVMGCVLREKECVGLIKVGILVEDKVDSMLIKPNHHSRILTVLWRMMEEEREKLGVIFNAAFRVSNVGNVYGFWCNEEDKCVYIVCEKLASSNFIDCVFKRKKDEKEGLSADEISFLGMVGVEICEILSRLHLEGLTIGYLSLSCLGFNEFGRVCVDLSEVVNCSRRVSAAVGRACKNVEFSLKDMVLDQNLVFLSPEVLLQLIVNEGFELDSRNVCKVGPLSDVWSVASLLVRVIVGSSFAEEMEAFLHSVINAVRDEKDCDYSGLYKGWMEKIAALLDSRLGLGCAALLDVLCRCLGLESEHRPMATELWKCLRGLIVKPQFDVGFSSKQEQTNQDSGCYVVLGDVCRVPEETEDCLKVEEVNDVVDGISRGRFKCVEMKGHLGFITALAIGGGLLFSSSFDKIVNVWSLQDFTRVHSFKGHEHKVMSVIFVDGEQPLCISGDNEGVICIWEAKFPFSEVPLKKLHENKDWRYSGIHAMANSGTEYLYTGSGDRLVKAWSLQDHTFVCEMSGHKSVVSSLIVCNGVLYSGSWDGSVRLWSLGEHSPIAVLGEDKIGNLVPVSSLSANHNLLFVGHDNGNIKIWHNDVLLKTTQSHEGCVFSVATNGKQLFSGGWDKKISVQEVSEAADGADVVPLGTIACNSPITALVCWHGKLFVGQADGIIKMQQAKVLFMQDPKYKSGWKHDNTKGIIKNFEKFQNCAKNSSQPSFEYPSSESKNPTPDTQALLSISLFTMNVDDDYYVTGGSPLARSLRVEKAKLNRKKDDNMSSIIKAMHEENQQLLEDLKKTNAQMTHYFEIGNTLREMKEENKLLFQNLSSIKDPRYRAFVQGEQACILQKELNYKFNQVLLQPVYLDQCFKNRTEPIGLTSSAANWCLVWSGLDKKLLKHWTTLNRKNRLVQP